LPSAWQKLMPLSLRQFELIGNAIGDI